jgi:hypothetical protein
MENGPQIVESDNGISDGNKSKYNLKRGSSHMPSLLCTSFLCGSIGNVCKIIRWRRLTDDAETAIDLRRHQRAFRKSPLTTGACFLFIISLITRCSLSFVLVTRYSLWKLALTFRLPHDCIGCRKRSESLSYELNIRNIHETWQNNTHNVQCINLFLSCPIFSLYYHQKNIYKPRNPSPSVPRQSHASSELWYHLHRIMS